MPSGVLQSFILGPLLLNIFLEGLFFLLNKFDVANYADDNMPYTSSSDVNGLLKSLEEAAKELFKWFGDNLMKRDPGKFHLLVSTNDNVAAQVRNSQIKNIKREKLYGLTTSCLSIVIYQKHAKNLTENFIL